MQCKVDLTHQSGARSDEAAAAVQGDNGESGRDKGLPMGFSRRGWWIWGDGEWRTRLMQQGVAEHGGTVGFKGLDRGL